MKFCTLLLSILCCSALIGSSQGAPASVRTVRLFHKLENLPYGQTPPVKVYDLVIELTRLHPAGAYRYAITGYYRIDPTAVSAVATVLLLSKEVHGIVDNSDLSPAAKNRIEKRISRPPFVPVEHGPTPPPSPTPTPSPTP
jgi:hypothetical protein